jgi:hypothetical protein
MFFVKKLTLFVVKPPFAFGDCQVVFTGPGGFDVKKIGPFACPDDP